MMQTWHSLGLELLWRMEPWLCHCLGAVLLWRTEPRLCHLAEKRSSLWSYVCCRRRQLSAFFGLLGMWRGSIASLRSLRPQSICSVALRACFGCVLVVCVFGVALGVAGVVRSTWVWAFILLDSAGCVDCRVGSLLGWRALNRCQERVHLRKRNWRSRPPSR